MAIRPPTQQERELAKMSGATLPDNVLFDTDTKEFFVEEPNSQPKPAELQTPTTGPSEQKPGFLSTIWNEGVNDVPILGTMKRQLTFNALPAAVGARAAVSAGPVAGIVAGLGSKLAQDYALDKVSTAHPDWQTATEFRRMQREQEEHPWLTAALSAPASVFGGGSLLPKFAGLTAKRAAAQAGLMGGINLGTQAVMSGGDVSQIDPKAALIAGVSAVPFSRPGRFSTAMGLGETAVPPKMQPDADLVRLSQAAERGETLPENPGAFPHERPTFNVKWLQEADPKEMMKVTDPYIREVARIRAAGVVPSEEQLVRLSKEGPGRGDYKIIGNEIITLGQQGKMAAGEDLAAKTAGNAEQVRQAQDVATTRSAVERLAAANPGREVTPAKPAEESAAVIAARPGEVSALSKQHEDYKKKAAMVSRQEKLLSKLDENDSEYPVYLQDYMNMQQDLAADRVRLLRSGGDKLLYGEKTAMPQDYALPKEKPAVEQPAVTPKPPPVQPPVQQPQPKKPDTTSQALDILAKEQAAKDDAALKAALAKTPEQLAAEKAAAVAPANPPVIPPTDELVGKPIKPAKKAAVTPGQQSTTALPETATKKPTMKRTAAKTEVPVGTEIPWGGATAVKTTSGWITKDAAGKEYPVTAKDAPAKIEAKAAEMLKDKAVDPATQKPTAAELTAVTPSQAEAQVAKQLGAEQSPGLKVKPSDKAKQGGFIRLPFKDLSEAKKKLEYKLRPAVEMLKRGGPVGRHVAGKVRDMLNTQRSIEYPLQSEGQKALKGLSEAERDNVFKAAAAEHDGMTMPVLSPKEQTAFNNYKAVIDKITTLKSQPNAPWVHDVDPQSGRSVTRPFIRRPGWLPVNVIKTEIRDILHNASQDPAAFARERQRYIDYLVNQRRVAPDEAVRIFDNQFNVAATGTLNPNPEFASLRYQEGLGVPNEWRERDLSKSLASYINNVATDLAYHQKLESDPVFATAMGQKDNGRGQAVPSNVMLAGKPVLLGGLRSDETLKAILRDYVSAQVPGGQKYEGFTHFVNSLRFGPVTQAKDILGAAPALAEILHPHEFKYVAQGLKRALFGDKEQAIKAGSVRGLRAISPALAADVDNGFAKLGDVLNKYQGSEALAQAGRVFADSIGRAVAKARMAAGDAAFFDKWGPSDWRSVKNPQEIIDFVAQEVANNVGSSYNSADLPVGMLKGQAGLFRPLFMVQRWAIGRANRWIDNVYTPAVKEGNIKPLLMSLAGGMLSAGAVNGLTQMLTERKPRELTWAEYLRLGDVDSKETAYTLFSKANIAGYAGILSNLGYTAMQMLSGEPPTGFNNMFYQAVTDSADVLAKWANAVGQREAGLMDFDKAVWEFARRTSQVLRTLTTQDDTGGREERIARRMGYMAPKLQSSEPTDPFSAAGAYKTEDVKQLRTKLQKRMESGQKISPPDSQVRSSVFIRKGQPVTYYDFVEKLQGKGAGEKALERDVKNTQKRYQLYSTALSQ